MTHYLKPLARPWRSKRRVRSAAALPVFANRSGRARIEIRDATRERVEIRPNVDKKD